MKLTGTDRHTHRRKDHVLSQADALTKNGQLLALSLIGCVAPIILWGRVTSINSRACQKITKSSIKKGRMIKNSDIPAFLELSY